MTSTPMFFSGATMFQHSHHHQKLLTISTSKRSGNKKLKQCMTHFVSTGHPNIPQHKGDHKGKTAGGLIHFSVLALGTAITAAIDTAIPLYKQSLTRMKFCPWKESGHRFTHLVCSPLNFTHVSNCSWQGHNRVYTCDLEKLLFFSCRAICLPPPPISTGNGLVCHRSSHITVAHQGNDSNSGAWVWMWSFSLPVVSWHD